MCFYESFTPNGHLLGGLLLLIFSLVVSLTSDLPHGSARNLLVLWGLQVKPPFSPESMKQSKSHAQELAKVRILPFVSHTQRFSS